MNYDLQKLNNKKDTLQKVREELKAEFFGIDKQIDQLIDSIRTWYLMPELIKYPVIVNLWSMTGSGKTALVRSLAHKLDKSNQFIEILPNHFKSDSSLYGTFGSISPQNNNIIFFDEFQKFNSKNFKGEDDNKENESLWGFLSEGRLSRIKYRIPYQILYQLKKYDKENDEIVDSDKASQKMREFIGSNYDGYRMEIKEVMPLIDFSLTEEEVSNMTLKECYNYIMDFQRNANPYVDYSKSLIIIAGNLDEVFPSSNSLSDCDTEADSYRKITEKISMIEIREALGQRFKPEHISRLGNNHIIYPSLSKDAYRKIIRSFSQKYLNDIKEVSEIDFKLSESVVDCIYDNSVYPTQGARPVFSSIHKIFGSSLSNAVIWALENNVNSAEVSLNPEKSELVFESPSNKTLKLPVVLDIKDRKARYSDDYTSLIAVHEMGHAILYSHFFQTPPEEIKINVASYTGGYNLYPSTSENKESILMRICVGYGGIIAEELVFGEGQKSTGSESDIAKITQLASNYVRRWGFNGIEARQDVPGMNGAVTFTDVKQSDSHIEGILQVQKSRAKEILTKNKNLLVELSKKLFDVKSLTKDQYVAMCAGVFEFRENSNKVDIFGDYHSKLFQK